MCVAAITTSEEPTRRRGGGATSPHPSNPATQEIAIAIEVEVEAPVGGRVVEISAQIDADIKTGTPLCVIELNEESDSI